jgi:DNA gyrase subunit B
MAHFKEDPKRGYLPENGVLPVVEAMRRRPGMYVGDTGADGLHYLVEGACRQAMLQLPREGGRLEVESWPDGKLTLRDNGPGLVTARSVRPGLHFLESVLTDPGPAISHALIGLCMVNGLSEQLVLETTWAGQRWHVECRQGRITQGPSPQVSTDTGTVLDFRPDRAIFRQGTQVDRGRLARRLEEFAALRPGLRTRLIDHTGLEVSREWHHPGGMADLLRARLDGPPVPPGICQVRGSEGDIHVDAALYWVEGPGVLAGFAGLDSTHGGTHMRGFKAAVTRTLRAWLRQNGNEHEARDWTPNRLRTGLRAIVAVQHPDPQFMSATRTWLGNPELVGFVQRSVRRALGAFLADHPTRTSPLFDHLAAARPAGDSA